MINKEYFRSALTKASLDFVPELIRNDLLESLDFLKESNINTEAILHIGSSNSLFKRSTLFAAIRKIYPGLEKQEITDTNEQIWELRNIQEEGGEPYLILFRDGQSLRLPDFTVLSPNKSARQQYLNECNKSNNLPDNVVEKWHQILIRRAIYDEEVDIFINEMNNTPIALARTLRNELINGEIQISSLVPNSRSYFECLAGKYDGSKTIQEYISTLKQLINRNLSWKSLDGFLLSLLLSSHSTNTAEINVESLSNEDLLAAYEFLSAHGDRISQIGAIEVGLRILPTHAEIESFIIKVIMDFQKENENQKISGFKIISSLFMLVDGEISRLRIFSNEPPFYRRLVSLAQASLIHRNLIDSSIDSENFCKWAFENRGEQFYMQSLCDMRMEPRWNPEYALDSHIKSDFLGRIIIASKKYENNIKKGPLLDLLHNLESESLNSLNDYYACFLPGPLEGTVQSLNEIPNDIKQEIETQLNKKNIEASSFIALVNSALLFRAESSYAELAANALKLANNRFANVKDKFQLMAILDGLGTVAAMTRSTKLADEIQILARHYRYDRQHSLTINEDIRVCLIAAASHVTLKEWKEFVGKWLEELAFGDYKREEGFILYSRLMCLCQVVPELWVNCGRAEAAVKAMITSQNN